jgi:L-alanine-DL-glutamate epimerase-like enolase superfamily enzyme
VEPSGHALIGPGGRPLRHLETAVETFPIRGVFAIARGSRTVSTVVVARIAQDGVSGQGECVPCRHYGETPESVLAQIESARGALERGADRAELLRLLPAGAARNATDAALWDLEARLAGQPAWQLAGLDRPPQTRTVRTLSLDTPEAMAARAAEVRGFGALKLKLDGRGDVARVEAVKAAAPECTLLVDANESWSPADLAARLLQLAGLGVALVEQPVKPADDAVLEGIARPLPVGADESFHTEADLDRVARRYDVVNLKLDKTGGLTAALAIRRAAETRGLDIMVGCMVGTSLSMAPGLVLAQGARFVDLDGPYLLERDRPPGLRLAPDGTMGWCGELWGG